MDKPNLTLLPKPDNATMPPTPRPVIRAVPGPVPLPPPALLLALAEAAQAVVAQRQQTQKDAA